MNAPINILFIEDNPGDARIVKEELRLAGSRTIVQLEWVDRLEKGLEQLVSNPFEAILLDLSLPDSEGLDTLQRVLAQTPQIPVIVMTGQMDEEVGMRAMQAGAQDYLIKGQVDGRLLIRSIQYAIQRKQTEMQLADALEFTERILTSSPIGILTYKFTGECLSANAYAAQMIGTTIEGLKSQNFRELKSWKKSGLYHLAEEAIASRKLTASDVHIVTTFGKEVWFQAQFVTFKSAGEELLLLTIGDITERKRAEEVLREKERLLAEAQRIGHIGSWDYDIPTDILQYSDEMYRLFDVSPQEFQHNREGFLNLIYSSDRPEVTRWMDLITSGRQVKELDFRVFHKNGELRYIQSRGAVEFDSTGKPVHFIGTAQDITERKLAEIQIRQQIEHLSALRRIDQTITANYDLHITLNTLLSEVSTQLQVDAAEILLLDPDGQMLEYAAGRGFRTRANESARVPIGESYAGRAAKERRLVRAENLKDQPHGPLLTTILAEEDFVCYYGVPLITKGKVIGVLEVFHRVLLQPYPEWIDFLHALAGQAAIAIENATLFENLEDSNRELSQAYDATIEGWSRALDLRDRETEGHTLRVTEMTMNLARSFGFSEEELLHIRRGALLHDIGKMGVLDHILLKPEPLTEEESAIMEKHAQYAYDLLKPIAFLKSALDIPYCHHEKWDGTGYPRRLKGEEIPMAARLFAVVDVWDALTSDRPYRPAWSEEEALTYIREQSGKHFDPQVVDLFFNVIK